MMILLLSCLAYIPKTVECEMDSDCYWAMGESICMHDGFCSDPNNDNDQDGFSPIVGDCDDFNPTIYPGAIDTLNDGIDQDCSRFDATWPGQGCSAMPKEPFGTLLNDTIYDFTFEDQKGNPFNLHSICDSVTLLRTMDYDTLNSTVIMELQQLWTTKSNQGFFSLLLLRNGVQSANRQTLEHVATEHQVSFPILGAHEEQLQGFDAMDTDKYIMLDRGSQIIYINSMPPSNADIDNQL